MQAAQHISSDYELAIEKARKGSSGLIYSRYLYYFYCITTIIGIFYCSLYYSFEKNIAALILGYFYNQLLFMTAHMEAHARFFEEKNYRNMGIAGFIAYLHHYKKKTSLSDLWLAHRLCYFAIEGVYFYQALLLVLYFFGFPVILMYVYWSLWQHVMSLSHEYYHLSKNGSKDHFNTGTRLLLDTLSRFRILDVNRHRKHHQHHVQTLSRVMHFEDLRMPRFISDFFDRMWQYNLRYHVSGKMNLVSLYIVSFLISCVLLTVAFGYILLQIP